MRKSDVIHCPQCQQALYVTASANLWCSECHDWIEPEEVGLEVCVKDEYFSKMTVECALERALGMGI
jgi:hypothetical protein